MIVELFLLHCNTWNHLTVCKQMNNVEYYDYYYIGILETIKLWENRTINVNNTWNHLTVRK